MSVLIPARDEEELLPHCLGSVKRALPLCFPEVTFDIVVAVNRSTDRTWELATEAVNDVGVVIFSNADTVGEARALAANVALKRYRGPRNRCWLANTDADCTVPANWLTAQLALAANGADAVAGTVDVVDFSEHHPVVEERFRRTYPIAEDGSHPHVHGANIGVRGDVYLRAGGWSNLASGEDHDLWKRLVQLGIRTVSVNHTRVITSGRRIGRAPHGFAAALAAHNENVA